MIIVNVNVNIDNDHTTCSTCATALLVYYK